MSGVDLSALDGTTIAGIDLRGTPLDRRLPPVPAPVPAEPPAPLPEAEPAGADDIFSFRDPSTGETIPVVPPAQ